MQKIDLEKYNFERNLLFCWPTGTGKTWDAETLIKKYASEHDSKLATYIMTDGKFKQMVKSNLLVLRWPQEWKTAITAFPLEMMLRCKVLLFDDLGVSDVTDAYLRDLTFVLDERIRKWLVTIFTTNLKKSELQEKLNERITSRALYNTDVVVYKWEDKRLATTNYYEK